MTKSSLNRKEIKKNLSDKEYDLVIIGGGITGAGIALDAASRGLKTALVEKNDYASGTSSRSTKLIHGGLRYLKQFEVALVREVGRERATVHRLAPHLVTSEKMLLPLTKEGNFGKILTSIGLMVYDVLAGVESIDQRKMLSKEEALEAEPLLSPEGLEGAGIYAEYRTDDARLTIEVIKTAISYGADCLNYCGVYDFIYDEGKVKGVKVRDEIRKKDFAIFSKFVVNATGPWVDDLRDINKSTKERRLYLSKGVHIVVPFEKFPVKQAVYYDVFDGRMIFSIPRGKITYIGTTDTAYEADKDHVVANKDDVDYLLAAANKAFPKINLTIEDVESSWAGVRPLIYEEGKSTSEVSRKDEIFVSETGLISIAGGKLTGYRKMAERVVDNVADKMNEQYKRYINNCRTEKITLAGAEFNEAYDVVAYQSRLAERLKKLNLSDYHAFHLVSNYGRQSDQIYQRIKEFDYKDQELNLVLAEAAFTIENEQAFTPVDYFNRRSGRLYFDIESVKRYKEQVCELFAEKLNRTGEEQKEDKEELNTVIHEATYFK
ncbi:MAG: glycerol-3-phosphate dehydrogenase/oxidase [Candidatus Cyclobacteriaceae bacterium M2_1C_046]